MIPMIASEKLVEIFFFNSIMIWAHVKLFYIELNSSIGKGSGDSMS